MRTRWTDYTNFQCARASTKRTLPSAAMTASISCKLAHASQDPLPRPPLNQVEEVVSDDHGSGLGGFDLLLVVGTRLEVQAGTFGEHGRGPVEPRVLGSRSTSPRAAPRRSRPPEASMR
jgi:hypothetical protein